MNYSAQNVERNPSREEKVSERKVLGFFGFVSFFVLNTEDTWIYFDSHGKYLAERKRLQEQNTKV